MKAKNLIKVLGREKNAEILINGKPIDNFQITYSCNSNGDWIINFTQKNIDESQKNLEN